MKSGSFNKVISILAELTHHQLSLLKDRVDSKVHESATYRMIDNCKQQDVIGCPHCGSVSIGRWGMASGLQRYKCKEELCGKTFNALTKTPFARLRKKHLWEGQVGCLNESITVRQSANRLGVAKTTAFRWRHRFLKASTANQMTEVSGIIEVDEMFFAESFKGKKTITKRKPHKRGQDADKRKKEDQIPVLIIKDRSGAIVDAVLKRNSKKEIGAVLKPLITSDSILCSDGARAYKSIAKENGLTHYRSIASKNERVIGKQFHVQNVNNYMMRMRKWISRFYGVGTEYLPNYLGWNRLMDISKKEQPLDLNGLVCDGFYWQLQEE
ncbi:transposase [Vibrio splendidus]|uniref:IS1595 family transposase n=1 Tax=Vibrio splendidus TaxID=29497 RepID=UPI000976017D|nr:IS1595 family transposase [Vibrio splendidus]OMO25405.1 transposase [Vibrio splendidus]